MSMAAVAVRNMRKKMQKQQQNNIIPTPNLENQENGKTEPLNVPKKVEFVQNEVFFTSMTNNIQKRKKTKRIQLRYNALHSQFHTTSGIRSLELFIASLRRYSISEKKIEADIIFNLP